MGKKTRIECACVELVGGPACGFAYWTAVGVEVQRILLFPTKLRTEKFDGYAYISTQGWVYREKRAYVHKYLHCGTVDGSVGVSEEAFPVGKGDPDRDAEES